MPVRRVKIFNGLQLQAFGLQVLAQGDEFRRRPELAGIAGQAPAALGAGGLIVARIVRATFEVIHQMRHNVRGARLPRELKMLAREHVPVKSEAQFHG